MSGPLADAHLHLFSRGYPTQAGSAVLGEDSEVGVYEALRRAHGIEAGLVVGYEGDGIDPGNNRYIRTLAAERPWMATLAYVMPDPAPDAGLVGALLNAGHVGLAIYLPDEPAGRAMAAWPAELWRRLEERRAILSLNARPDATRVLAPVILRHAACRFVFSHLGLPGRHESPPSADEAATRLRDLIGLSDCPNALVKISGLYAIDHPPHAAAEIYVALVLDTFGPGRCLWGSDFSPALEFASFADTLSSPALDRLSVPQREQVMGLNLLKLLGRQGDDR